MSHEYQHLIEYRYDRDEETWSMRDFLSYPVFYAAMDCAILRPTCWIRIGLTAWDNTLDNALKHYAKAALWTYYLYEKLADL